MSATLPIPRADVRPRRSTPTAAKGRTSTLQRERHQPDYSILVVVVALIAIGILMVYSSSAMKAYLQDDDTLGIVGPQIGWAALGLAAMATMMRVDYRYLRLISVPVYIVAIVLLVLVFVPSLNIVVGGSARWLKIGPLPAVHPAEIAKLAMVIYLAHWFAKRGSRIRGFWSGTIPFLIITVPILALVFREPDLGTTMVLGLTAITMFYLAGANLAHLAAMAVVALFAIIAAGLRGYQIERIQAWLNPWADPMGKGFHTIQGLLALGLGGVLGAGLGESRLAGGLFLPEREQRLHLRDHRRGVRARRRGHRHCPVRRARVLRDPRGPVGAGHLRGAARGGNHRLALHPGLHQHRRRRRAHPGDRHHATVHQRRRLVPHHQPRRRRHPIVDISRDRRTRKLERCGC